MGNANKDLPVDDGDAPPSERRSAPSVIATSVPSEAAPAYIGDPPPPSGDRLSRVGVTAEELRAFVARPEIQRRIREIVMARVHQGTPKAVVDDILQDANVAVLASKSRPRSMTTASGWVATVTARTVASYFRREATHLRWLNRETEVEEQPSDPQDAPADGWLIAGWLAPIVAHHPRDQETYELLLYKARTAKSHDEVAADHGMTAAALKSRIHQFKERYLPRWRRRQSMLVLFVLFGVAAFVLVAWLVWRLARPDTIEPDPARVPLPITPSATASSSDTPFDPARPTPAPVDTRERKSLPPR